MRRFYDIYKSIDEGVTWVVVGHLPSNSDRSGTCKALFGVGSTLYAHTTLGILKSTNFGLEWMPLASSKILKTAPIESMLVDSKGSIYINAIRYYSDGGRGTFKSSDGGDNWIKVDFGVPNPPDFQADRFYPKLVAIVNKTLYASSYGGLISSNDEGKSWVASDAGMLKPRVTDGNPFDVVFSVQVNKAGILYAVTQRNVYKGTGALGTWQALPLKGISGLPIP